MHRPWPGASLQGEVQKVIRRCRPRRQIAVGWGAQRESHESPHSLVRPRRAWWCSPRNIRPQCSRRVVAADAGATFCHACRCTCCEGALVGSAYMRLAPRGCSLRGGAHVTEWNPRALTSRCERPANVTIQLTPGWLGGGGHTQGRRAEILNTKP